MANGAGDVIHPGIFLNDIIEDAVSTYDADRQVDARIGMRIALADAILPRIPVGKNRYEIFDRILQGRGELTVFEDQASAIASITISGTTMRIMTENDALELSRVSQRYMAAQTQVRATAPVVSQLQAESLVEQERTVVHPGEHLRVIIEGAVSGLPEDERENAAEVLERAFADAILPRINIEKRYSVFDNILAGQGTVSIYEDQAPVIAAILNPVTQEPIMTLEDALALSTMCLEYKQLQAALSERDERLADISEEERVPDAAVRAEVAKLIASGVISRSDLLAELTEEEVRGLERRGEALARADLEARGILDRNVDPDAAEARAAMDMARRGFGPLTVFSEAEVARLGDRGREAAIAEFRRLGFAETAPVDPAQLTVEAVREDMRRHFAEPEQAVHDEDTIRSSAMDLEEAKISRSGIKGGKDSSAARPVRPGRPR